MRIVIVDEDPVQVPLLFQGPKGADGKDGADGLSNLPGPAGPPGVKGETGDITQALSQLADSIAEKTQAVIGMTNTVNEKYDILVPLAQQVQSNATQTELYREGAANSEANAKMYGNGSQVADLNSSPDVNVNNYNVATAGTYANFSGVVVSPGDLSSGQVRLMRVGGVWTKSIVPLALGAYTKKADFDAVANEIATVAPVSITMPLAFRLYTALDVFVITSASVVQEDHDSYITLSKTAGTAATPVYYRTGKILTETVGILRTEAVGKSLVAGSSYGFGVGCLPESGVPFYYLYRGSDGVFSKVDNYGTTTAIATGLTFFTTDDVIRFDLVLGEIHALNIYKNGTLIRSQALPVNLTGELCWAQRGSFSANVTKPKVVIEKVASKTEFKELTTSLSTVNPNTPFIKTARFITDYPGITTDPAYPWIKDFIVAIKLYGFNPADKISVYIVRRAYPLSTTFEWRLDFYKDTGSGNGVTKELILSWVRINYVEPPAGQIDHIVTAGTVRFEAYVDWTKCPIINQSRLTYNSSGFDRSALINFNAATASADTPDGVTQIKWQYNNANYPTNKVAQYVVVPDKNPVNGVTAGCTGLTYDSLRKQVAVAYYNYEWYSAIHIFSNSDLIPYPGVTPAILPVPTKIIDISSYLEQLQGVAYDRKHDTYWALGLKKGIAQDDLNAGTNRVLIEVDQTGGLLDYYVMSDYDFSAGMICVYGDSIYIKPNNAAWLLELDKSTKLQIRKPNTFTNNEGFGINQSNGDIWLCDDNGSVGQYSNSLVLIANYVNESFGNEIEGICIFPDGSICFAADTYLHGLNPNGNCIWVFDYKQLKNKSVSFPEMFNFSKGLVSGGLRISNNVLTGTGNWESPIMDFDTHSDYLTNALAVSQAGRTVTVTYRGSNTAPTLAPDTQMQVKVYPGWGSTIPSTYSSLSAFRFIQFKINIAV